MRHHNGHTPGGEAHTPPHELHRDLAGGWLLGAASTLLLALAAAQGYVSFRAQYTFVHQIKGEPLAAMLEALGLDCAAVIFALLALAQARLGRPALPERVLNLACVAGSLAMNAASADWGNPKSVAAWVLPALLYAASSDRLIAVVRRRALARVPGADTERSAYAVLGSAALWLLRLTLAAPSTFTGFRAWVIRTAPVAPGLRTGAEPPGSYPAAPAAPHPDRAGSYPAAPAPGSPAQDGSYRAAPALNGTERPRRGLPAPRKRPPRSRRRPSAAAPPPRGAKRETLIRLYDELGAAGDPRHGTRDGVGEMARELHERAGLSAPSTAVSYLHKLLDERHVPRSPQPGADPADRAVGIAGGGRADDTGEPRAAEDQPEGSDG